MHSKLTYIGSRRLLTYSRVVNAEVDQSKLASYHVRRLELQGALSNGTKSTADDLNHFRKKYFQGFKTEREWKFDAE